MTTNEDKFTRQTLTAIHSWSDRLFSLRCSRDQGFRFRAGQFARLGLPKADGSIVWRAYSMVSAPHDEFLEFFSIVVPGGEFTSLLNELKVGDTLLVDRQAFGFLTLDRFIDGDDLWMLASGTGIAPFLSMLQDFEVWERFSRIKLVYSARHAHELAYRELIEQLRRRDYLAEYAERLQFIPVVTGEPFTDGLNQRVTELLKNGQLENCAGLAITPERSRVMVCGNPSFVTDVRGLLKERGLQLSLSRRPGQVGVENYW